MASKPMYTFLDSRLANCRIQRTSVQESGIRVSTQPTEDEKIVFFHTDTDEGRECLEMRIEGESSEKICDYLIYYTREGRYSEIVCFLELKGTDLAKAEKQVVITLIQTRTLMQKEIHSKYLQNFIFRICICLRSQAPSTSQRIRDSLIQNFGGRNIEIRHGVKRHDIGPLLRRDTE